MKISTALLALLCSILPFSALARTGDWGSAGGGEFLRDLHNPWFVKGVSEVRYCLRIDPAGFSASPAKVAELSERAFAYWKGQLATRAAEIGVGTQAFTLNRECTGHEDLTLLFGHGALSEAQLKLFTDNGEDPLDYVGIAIRTAYDKESLRGRGFVFISSDQGEHIYNRGQGVARKLWSYDGLLFRALQHELGHVFGISHTDEGFMAADFPENMVRNYRRYRTVGETPFFEPASRFDSCDEHTFMSSGACVQGETTDQWQSFSLTKRDDQGKPTAIGTVSSAKRTSTRLKFPLKIFLPKEQKIFPAQPSYPVRKGPARQEFKVSGTLITPSGEKKPVLLDLRPDGGEAFFDSGKGFDRH